LSALATCSLIIGFSYVLRNKPSNPPTPPFSKGGKEGDYQFSWFEGGHVATINFLIIMGMDKKSQEEKLDLWVNDISSG
jgi:hypothetical protein